MSGLGAPRGGRDGDLPGSQKEAKKNSGGCVSYRVRLTAER